jgi:histidinol-phosphate/aromatic aminotransferase/cobyric acid decarboxylase-like protein
MATTRTAMRSGAHGGDGRRVARALGLDPDSVLDLSQSLNPVAPDPRPVIAAAVGAVGRYPDAEVATAALADQLGVEADRVVLTNGGSEAIALAAGDLGTARIVEPEFSQYRRHVGAVVDDPAAPRIRSNPNNPTGCLAAPDDRDGAVWDEAFWPLATGSWTRGDADAGAVVVGSLTKVLACPGLRVGYVLAPDAATAARLRDRQPEWAVSGLAAESVPALLRRVDLPAWSAAIGALRAELVAVLRAHGLASRPSDANWVLVDAPGLRERLAPEGVVVRDCASFGLDGVARVAVPDEHGLERLDAALARTARA